MVIEASLYSAKISVVLALAVEVVTAESVVAAVAATVMEAWAMEDIVIGIFPVVFLQAWRGWRFLQ